MTTEEKLRHFEEICVSDAKKKYEQEISDFTAYQEKQLAEHIQAADKQAETQLAEESEKIRREINKKLSISQIDIKREYSQKQEELKAKIFSELRDKLARFMETPQYDQMLIGQIKKARDFAGKDEIHIYIDPSDQDKQRLLSMETGCEIRVSQYSFLGGTRAVIASRNILIDNSFETRLKEAEENFQFLLGGK